MADEFPENIVNELVTACERIFSGTKTEITDFMVVTRPLIPMDPERSIGIFPFDWVPNDNEFEMGHPSPGPEPLFSRYNIRLHLLVKQIGDDTDTRATFTRESKNLRAMLYRDPELAVRLRSLSESKEGVTERLMKWGIATQRFMQNEVSGPFMYLSATNAWFETTS